MQNAPLVGLVMGSDSDWPLVSKAHETLAELGIPHEVRVMSAHRTPDLAHEYSATAEALILALDRGDLDWRDIVNPKTKPFMA